MAPTLIFYAPDLVFIHERSAALKNVQVYIGDGGHGYAVVYLKARQITD